MSDWPDLLTVPMKTITPFSEEALGAATGSAFSGLASRVVGQNIAFFYPFRLDYGRTAVKMASMSGATLNGNVDVGIYDDQFNYLISSGATLQANTNAIQEFDITDTYLPPGFYWMALSSSSATATMFCQGNLADEFAVPSWPSYIQTSAHPLPTTVAAPIISTETGPIGPIMMGVSFDTLI